MPVEITEKLAQRATCRSGRVVLRDSRIPGFILRVGKEAKTFALACRDDAGRVRTVTLGTYPELTVKEARTKAEEARASLRQRGPDSTPSARVPQGVQPSVKDVTLAQLIIEAEAHFSRTLKSWRCVSAKSQKSRTRQTIEAVFQPLLDCKVEELTAHDLARAVSTYKPQGRGHKKLTANGQVSRAMSYLSPPLSWAAHRGRFRRIGAGRPERLDAPDIREVFDPATDDPTLERCRTRVLTIPEFLAIYPLLVYPRPAQILRTQVEPEDDFGFIALRFVLLTAARISEVSEMVWADVDWLNGVWIKSDTKGRGLRAKTQLLPLSDAALALLRTLPHAKTAAPRDRVFPNGTGGRQMNWNRVSRAIKATTGTTGWTRHDLRRTASTVMLQAGVPLHIIETILNHSAAFQNVGASASAAHYLVVAGMWRNEGDPIRDALNKLSATYDRLFMMSAHRPG